MTEHKEKVIRHAMLLEAEDWAKGVSGIHVHSFSSMWYDNHPEDTNKGNVTDTSYNDDTIVRTKKGKVIRVFGEALEGDALIDAWAKANQDKAQVLSEL